MIVKRESDLLNEFNEYKRKNNIQRKFDVAEFESWFKIAYPQIKTVHFSNIKIKIK